MTTFLYYCRALILSPIIVVLASCGGHSDEKSNVALDPLQQRALSIHSPDLQPGQIKTIELILNNIEGQQVTQSARWIVVLPTVFPSLYQVISDREHFYTDSSGRYRLDGRIVDQASSTNLSALDQASVHQLAKTSKAQPGDIGAQSVTAGAIKDGGYTDDGRQPVPEIQTVEVDDWREGAYVPSNYAVSPMKLSEPLIDHMASIALNYPGYLSAKVVDALTITRSYLANRIPDDLLAAVYRPEEAREGPNRITAFVDPSCPNCKKLHNDIKKLVDSGFEVRYVLFSRAGADSSMGKSIATLPCLEPNDRKVMVEALFSGQDVNAPESCGPAATSELESALGFYDVTQTPTIFIDAVGASVPGYVPAADIMKLVTGAIERVNG